MWLCLVVWLTHLWISFGLRQPLLGGKQTLPEDQLHSANFRALIDEANLECNKRHNDVNWFKKDAISSVTQQVVQGMNYEFILRQLRTECKKNKIMQNVSALSEYSCPVDEKKIRHICSVSLWHRPWLREKSLTTIKELWRVEPLEKFLGATYRKVKLGESNFLNRLITNAVLNYNVNNATKELYKVSGQEVTIKKDKLTGSTVVNVDLQETACKKKNFPNGQVQNETCFNEESGILIQCQLHLNESSLELRSFNVCHPQSMNVRGMWRLAAPRAVQGNPCTEHAQVGQYLPIREFKHFASYNARPMTLDEQNDPEFNAAIQLALSEYYNRLPENDSSVRYQLHEVKEAKLKLAPNVGYEVTLILKPTTCTNGNFPESRVINSTCALLPAKLCNLTLPHHVAGELRRQSSVVIACKNFSRQVVTMVGRPMYVPKDRRRESELQGLLERITEQFNNENNLSYVFELSRMANVKHQVVAGSLYTMDITFISKKIKDTLEELKSAKINETTVTCKVKVWQKPWLTFEQINITDCWHATLRQQTITGDFTFVRHNDRNLLEEHISKDPLSIDGYDENEGKWRFSNFGDVRLINVDGKVVYLAQSYLKNENTSQASLLCDILAFPDAEASSIKAIYIYNCQQQIDKVELQSVLFQRKMKDLESAFNERSETEKYHQFVGLKNATRIPQEKKTVYFAHLQAWRNCKHGNKTDVLQSKPSSVCNVSESLHPILCEVHMTDVMQNISSNVEFKECNKTEPQGIFPMYTVKTELEKTSSYGDMIHRVELTYNLKSDKNFLYQMHQIENITSQERENRAIYRFLIYLRPSACSKWEEFVLFGNKKYDACSLRPEDNVIKCEAEVNLIAQRLSVESVHLRNCEEIFVSANKPLRPMNSSERLDPQFRKIVDIALNILNDQSHSSRTFDLVTIEDPKVGFLAGRYHTMRMHVFPSKCRRSLKTVNSTSCEKDDTKYSVSCSIQVWQKAWEESHLSVDFISCSVIPSARSKNSRKAMNDPKKAQDCVDELLPNFISLLKEHITTPDAFAEPDSLNIEAHDLPGNRLTFDLNVKEKDQEDDCQGGENNCRKPNFYTCKASIWIRPWTNIEDYDLIDCANVSSISSALTAPNNREALETFKAQAVQLYNQLLAKKYEFRPSEVKNVDYKTEYGAQITFTLLMEPVSCLGQNIEDEHCIADNSQLRAQCSVVATFRPWEDDSKALRLQNCFETYQDNDSNMDELSDEERNSDRFKEAVNKLVNLYNPPVSISYALKEVQNVKLLKDDNWRNITLVIVLRNVACGLDPVTLTDCPSLNSANEVSCDGLIAENKKSGGFRHLYLTNCHFIWEPEFKRSLTDAEKSSDWFKQTIQQAWTVASQMTEEEKLYKIESISNATLEVAENRTVSYTLILLETDCIRNRDENKLLDSSPEQCSILDNPRIKTCQVVNTVPPDGFHRMHVSCVTEKTTESKTIQQ